MPPTHFLAWFIFLTTLWAKSLCFPSPFRQLKSSYVWTEQKNLSEWSNLTHINFKGKVKALLLPEFPSLSFSCFLSPRKEIVLVPFQMISHFFFRSEWSIKWNMSAIDALEQLRKSTNTCRIFLTSEIHVTGSKWLVSHVVPP